MKMEQVIIGLDNLEMLPEMELLMSPDIGFGIEEIMDEDGDEEDEDDSDEGWVSVIKDEDSEFESSEELDNWTSFETMRSCHPLYFANIITEIHGILNVVSWGIMSKDNLKRISKVDIDIYKDVQ